jgi:tRNA (cytidine/uridine-2'-O-)-methyltransferase
MRLVLYQPDIAPNAGALMRLAACLDLPVDLIEPCGFTLDDGGVRRAGMDYLDRLDLARHTSWSAYLDARRERQRQREPGRLVLLTTRGEMAHTEFEFTPGDDLMVGRESAGVPDAVHAAADVRLRVPMRADARSLNVATALAIVAGEALRQTGGCERLAP